MNVRMAVKVIAFAFLIGSGASIANAQQRGGFGPHPGGPLFNVLAAIGHKVAEVNWEAMHSYETLPREGTCDDRRNEWLAVLPDATLLGSYSRDIYETANQLKMQNFGKQTLDLGGGDVAYLDSKGERYAELRMDRTKHRAVVVFGEPDLAFGQTFPLSFELHRGRNR